MTEEKTSGAITMGKPKTEGDWINRIIADHCRVVTQEAQEAVAEVKDEDGNVTVEGKRAVAEKSEISDEKLDKLAHMNELALKDSYPNIGMKRMALGNKMRAAAKRRGGLMLPDVNGDATWTDAPDDFEVNEQITENADGTKIAKAEETTEDA